MLPLINKTAKTLITVGICAAALTGCGSGHRASFPLPEGPVESSIYVPPVPGIPDGFIRGMDASSVLAEEKSGVVYYNERGERQDVFLTFAQSGVNYIRLRVWNDPYDGDGRGYGGGNNDLATAVELGRRATAYGMKVCIDFHYSDFWADPKRQHAPKAWRGMDAAQKGAALYAFTKESLAALLKAGVDVGMVQVGNEINYGMAGEKGTAAVMGLLREGSRAVRESAKAFKKDIQVAVHYTKISEPEGIAAIATTLRQSGVDYDVFGLSYYPFWDGPLENMQGVVRSLRRDYGKSVMLVETSYCYTAEDGDGFGNSLAGTDDIVPGYPATVQGQAAMIRDVFAAAHEAGAAGVFYWEGAWLPVGKAAEDNAPVWEKYGSGWASSYAAAYDPEDAGLYYGGSSWDNQAFFDFGGHPLASINVFRYLKHGSTAPRSIDYIPVPAVTANVGERLSLPKTVDVLYNDRTSEQAAVTWDAARIAAIDTARSGKYTVAGNLADGTPVSCRVELKPVNYVKNPGFEDADRSAWKVSYAGADNPTDYQRKPEDARSGETAFHFYSGTSDMDFAIEQEFTQLQSGTYRLSVFAQGGDMAEDAAMELYAVTNNGKQGEPFMVTGWADWKNPEIPAIQVTDGRLTIGVRIRCNAKSWGTLDDFTLNRISD